MKYKRGPKRPNLDRLKDENRIAWTKIDGALLASEGILTDDQLTAVLRDITRCIKKLAILFALPVIKDGVVPSL